MTYLATIETRVRGIPCQIGVISFDHYEGSFSYNAPSDLDYSGYSESDWVLLDRKGYKASWLEHKLTERDIEEIETEIFNNFVEC